MSDHSPAQTPAKTAASGMQRPTLDVLAPLHREFDRFLSRLESGWNMPDVPRMDVRDNDEGVEITVELPGMDRKDVTISIEDDVLTISGEKKSETERYGPDYRLSERSFGSFSRSIGLPRSVATDKIEATMHNGVLRVKAPRAGQTQKSTIEIRSAN